MRVEERVRPAAQFKPEVASLNMGSINFGLYHLLNKYTEFQFEWEREHLEATRDLIFRNSFKDIEYILSTCYDNGTRFEFECYDIAHLYNLAHFADRGLVKAPFFVQSVFGLLGGIGTHPEDVIHMRRTADRLFGKDYRWSVLGAGASQFRIAGSPPPWAAMCGLVWRTACGPARAGWRSRTPNRCARCGRSSRAWACRSPRPRMPAASRSSRAATRWRSESKETGMRIEILADVKTTLGEGPLWDVDEQRLYWIDSFDGRVFRCTADGRELRAWDVPQKIGSMALRKQGGRWCRWRAVFTSWIFAAARSS